jgi:MFS family permease
MGGLSDRLGRRKVLVPAILIFSLLSWLSGVATGLVSLLLIRAVMGVSEGAVASTGVAICTEASHPKRRGINQGVFQCCFALLGGALAPIIATQMLTFTTWRMVFLLTGIPGIIVALIVWRVIREPDTIGAPKADAPPRPSFKQIFQHRNVALGMVTLICAMTGVFVMGAMIPVYLQGYLKLSAQNMGFVASAAGFGGFLGQFSLPAISDIIGRKMAILGAFILASIFLFAFSQTGAGNLPLLFVLLFGASMFSFGALAVTAGPLAAEAAPLGMIGAVSGLVIGAGEVFGGGVAPSIAGALAQNYGLPYVLYFALGGQVLGVLLSLFLKETSPRKTTAAEAAVSAAAVV